MVAVRKDYAAPPGLKFILVWDSTNMPRLTALKTAVAKCSLEWTNGTTSFAISGIIETNGLMPEEELE